MKERGNLRYYFDLFRGTPAQKNKIPTEAHSAVEALINGKELIAQQGMDGSEMIIPTDKLKHARIIDIGLKESDTVWEAAS